MANTNSFNAPRFTLGMITIGQSSSLSAEQAFSITPRISGKTEMIIGNELGSNIINVLLILGYIAIIQSVNLP
ncbi:hypothetical protein [Pragia fontium]|uniref:hypothetical protein n=1 Tax=Pragia fontium TaxID=82985 RepID=UPI0039969DEE